MPRAEGIRRLSLFVGIFAGIGFYLLIATTKPVGIRFLLVGLPIYSIVAGFAGWGLVRTVKWIIDGFADSSR